MNEVLKILDSTIGFQTEAHEFRGEDGYPTAVVFSPVCVTTVDGRLFFLPMGEQKRDDEEGFIYYTARYDGKTMLERVRRSGVIHTQYWIEMDNRSLEERWNEAADIEQEERMTYYL